MQLRDEAREGQAKAKESISDLLFLALNDFQEFERKVLHPEQDPRDHAAKQVKST
jgi:hypothetical protein